METLELKVTIQAGSKTEVRRREVYTLDELETVKAQYRSLLPQGSTITFNVTTAY
jgi:hypothetical protein